MNPNYGIILWIIIGAFAGWIGSKIMGTNARQGGAANIFIGILGALLGGYLTRVLFGDWSGDNGLIASFFVALLGSCIVIFFWKLIGGPKRI
jgi:uncharacterized membrane protein YeaQ/YmgE (transglycosylase-associated protein family)